MPNPYRIATLGFVSVLSIGAIATMEPRMPEPDAASAPTLGALYAAPVERIETHVLERGETLSGVLAQARITGQEMSELLLGLRQHLNPGRLSLNSEITVRRWSESGQPRSVEVRVNADSTVRLVRREIGWDSEIVLTPTRTDTVYSAGVIDRERPSLYEAVVMDEASDLPVRDRRELVYKLAGIYEYKMDFTREIQPGDRYRLAYERDVRPDGSARAVRILSAEIVNQGRAYQAFWFDGSSEVTGYFDEEARPLAAGFSRYPVAFPRITSNYNPNRYHPILGTYRAHNGTDFGASTGTPVMSTANGTVTFAGTNAGYGRMIEIRHFNGYTTRYAHLSRFAPGIRVGTKVSQKDLIGYVGKTGLATAPHLHYELRVNGRPVNARTAKLPDTPPIPGKLRTDFLAVARARAALLDRATPPAQYAEVKSLQAGTNRAGDEL